MGKEIRSGLIILFVLSWFIGRTEVCVAATQTAEAIADGTNVVLSVNGSPVNVQDQSPYIEYNPIMGPVSLVADVLGAVANQDNSVQTVTIGGEQDIKMMIGSLAAIIAGLTINPDMGSENRHDCIIVPLSFINSSLGVAVQYKHGPENNLDFTQDVLVDVDVSDQKVRVFQGSKLCKELPASTGYGDSTPLGWFTIQNRGEWFYSEKYQEGAMWWVSFKDWGIYLFHSIPMDRQRTVIDSEQTKLGTPASHGCVRLAIEDAKWIYDNIPQGTPVYIHQ